MLRIKCFSQQNNCTMTFFTCCWKMGAATHTSFSASPNVPCVPTIHSDSCKFAHTLLPPSATCVTYFHLPSPLYELKKYDWKRWTVVSILDLVRKWDSRIYLNLSEGQRQMPSSTFRTKCFWEDIINASLPPSPPMSLLKTWNWVIL